MDRIESWFDATGEAIAIARRFVGDALAEHGCTPDGVEVAVLLTSELATNVVEHTNSDRIGLRVSMEGPDARIEVIDCDPGTGSPAIAHPDPTAVRGRGLRIVEAMAKRWGYDDRVDHRVVWVDVACA